MSFSTIILDSWSSLNEQGLESLFASFLRKNLDGKNLVRLTARLTAALLRMQLPNNL